MGLIPGVVALNVVLLAVGFALLSSLLRGRRWLDWLSWAGLALVTGMVALGVVLTAVAVAGARVGNVAFGSAAALLAVAGLLVRASFRAPLLADDDRRGGWLAVVARYGAFVVAVTALVGGFRSSPWLDDSWNFWVPKGVALSKLGLTHALFTRNSSTAFFPRLEDPLAWSFTSSAALRFVGGAIDLRAVDAELTILVLAFIAAAARLLAGRVRPTLLWIGVLLLIACPAVFRQAQGGGADLPVAFSLALFALGAVGWLAGSGRFALVVAAIGGIGALHTKSEGLPQLLVLALALTLVGLGSGRARVGLLWAVVGVALASLAPWLIWLHVHGVHDEPIAFSKAIDPSYLAQHTDRGRAAVWGVARWPLKPTEWLLEVPLAVTLSAYLAWRRRTLLLLAPLVLVGLGYLFWVWAMWADPFNRATGPVPYRFTDTLVLVAAFSIPALLELAARGPVRVEQRVGRSVP